MKTADAIRGFENRIMSSNGEIMGLAALIIGAATYLGHRIWRKCTTAKDEAGCGTCGHNAAAGTTGNDVVPLDALHASAEKVAAPH